MMKSSMRNWQSSAIIVKYPMNEELNRIQAIINDVKGVSARRNRGPLSDSLDVDGLQEIVFEARKSLRTKASQRITVLGQTGVGKSTTLNILLSCTVVSDEEYCRVYSQAETKTCKFYQTKYFCESDANFSAVRL
jgi:ABC-type transport system involved in cytochrome bd biosynthesis fused ATPase/permease subunit